MHKPKLLREPTPFNELCIATLVGIASDRFGVPAVCGEPQTASGLPLSDDLDAAGAAAEQWVNEITGRLRWMFESEAIVEEPKAAEVMLLIAAAFGVDTRAAAQAVNLLARYRTT